MPSRASASARFGPTPLRYLTEVANCSVTPLPPSPAVHRQFTRRSPAYQALGVRLSVKHFEILKPFPGTDKTDRHGHRALHRDHAPALRRAVELRDDETRERQGRGEGLRLVHSILAHRAVEHEQRLVWRVGPLLRDHAHHLF